MSPVGPSPNPNIPSEYCSTIPPLQQARAAGTLNSPPPTVMVPVSVLKQPNNDSRISLKYQNTRSSPCSAFMQCTLNKYNFRLSSWTKARLVCWWHLTQRGGGGHIQAVGDEPQRLTGVQQWRSWPTSSEITQNNICSMLMITQSKKWTRSTLDFSPVQQR